jgi:hypothetical protein
MEKIKCSPQQFSTFTENLTIFTNKNCRICAKIEKKTIFPLMHNLQGISHFSLTSVEANHIYKKIGKITAPYSEQHHNSRAALSTG